MAQPPSSSVPLAWSIPGHQGQDVALPKPRGAVEGHRPETPDLAKPPDGRPAGGEHLHDLAYPQKAFFRPLGPLPELGRTPAAGQNSIPIIWGKGLVEFKGGFDEPVEAGNHGGLIAEVWKWVKGAAGTL